MSRRDYVSRVIDELGRSMGLSDLSLDERGRVTLLFDDAPVTFSYSEEPAELLWLFVELADIDPERKEPLEALLQLGLLTWSWSRMTIGASEDGRKAMGHTAIPVVNLDLVTLKDALRPFLDSAMSIRERMASGDYDLGMPVPGGDRPGSGIRA
jgi:hypothetical protein